MIEGQAVVVKIKQKLVTKSKVLGKTKVSKKVKNYRENVGYQTNGYENELRAMFKAFWSIWKSHWKMSNDFQRHQNNFGLYNGLAH